MNAAPLDSLSYSRFCELIGTRFHAQIPGRERVTFELNQITVGSKSNPAASKGTEHDNFSLFFHGPAEPVYAQATYRFEHEALGAFDLFIVPVGREAAATIYQAVFNRMS